MHNVSHNCVGIPSPSRKKNELTLKLAHMDIKLADVVFYR